MENLLVSLNEAEVGNLSSLSATLPIELPDGNGGTLCDLKEQILANAAVDMMDRWSYHKDWSKVEARLAGQILLRVEKEEVGGGAQLRKEHYLSVVNAYAKVTAEDETASIRAENILDHLETRVAEGRSDLKPDRLIINTVMGAQAKHALSGTLNIANITAAGRMLDTLEREFALGDRTMQPTARTYSKFIDLFAKAGRAEEAAKALKRMETQYRNGNKAALPKTIHYTSVIDAIAKSDCTSNKSIAEEVLHSMLDLYSKGDNNLAPDHLAPDTIIFNTTLDAFAKSSQSDAVERSLSILEIMEQYQTSPPDIVTYNIVLNTLSHDKRYISKAKEILHFIEQSKHLRADSFSYNAVIKCCPPEEAEKLIQEMEYLRKNTDERPDSYTYTSLINSWTNTNTLGYEEKCAKILRWMEDKNVVGMNRIVYNEVMRAYSRSSRDDAGELAFSVFCALERRYRESKSREWLPDRFSFIHLLNAYTRSCKSHKRAATAQALLLEMMGSNYAEAKNCNNVISAWARSGSVHAASQAEIIIERMDSHKIEIDGVVFNSLVNVYAKTPVPNKSISALKVLDRMEERGVDPTCVTYTLLVEACLGDDEYLMKIFESCTKHGMLDEKLEHSFKKHGPACIRCQLSGKIPYMWRHQANRGHGGPSRRQIKQEFKKGSTGADVRKFGWAR